MYKLGFLVFTLAIRPGPDLPLRRALSAFLVGEGFRSEGTRQFPGQRVDAQSTPGLC